MTVLPLPYQPEQVPADDNHPLVVLEGVSGIGKSTLAAMLGRTLAGTTVHTLPPPHTEWSTAVNTRCRPLPQFAFYLAGALHGSDVIRGERRCRPVIADRYLSSVIACHAAVHGVSVSVVTDLLEPFLPYFTPPTVTFYLRCREPTLRERMATKPDRKDDDTALLSVPGRLATLLANFKAVAESDPTAVVIDTNGRTPSELATQILTHLEGTPC